MGWTKKRACIRRIIVQNSQKEVTGYNEVRDFYMSEKFGLDWQEYDSKRVEALFYILQCQAERDERESKKAGKMKK